MSRTDAHRPYWVQVMHAAQDHEWYSYEWHFHRRGYDCNIDEEVYQHNSTGIRPRYSRWINCEHEIDWSQASKFCTRGKWVKYGRQKYWGSQRARVRDALKRGEYEIEPSRPRNSVLWDW